MVDKNKQVSKKPLINKAPIQKDTKSSTSKSATPLNQADVSAQAHLTDSKVLALQQAAGNKAVQRFLAQRQIQTKLTVGAANDHYEQEADRVAEQVMSTSNSSGEAVAQRAEVEEDEIQTKSIASTITPVAQREAVEEDEVQTKPIAQREAVEEEEVQTKPIAQREAVEEEEVQTKRLAQREAAEEDEVQTKPLAQREAVEEEEVQTKRLAQREAAEEEEVQTKRLAQREAVEEEEVQTKRLAQREAVEEELQTKSQPKSSNETFEAGDNFEKQLDATRGNGSPLPEQTRDFMESRFGADFGDVRLHKGSDSIQLNRAIQAQAFTQGKDIYLGAGKEDIESNEGKQLLAHELTHVVQQTGAKK